MPLANNNPASIYLRELREKLRRVPVSYGIDDGDIDNLTGLAQWFDATEYEGVSDLAAIFEED